MHPASGRPPPVRPGRCPCVSALRTAPVCPRERQCLVVAAERRPPRHLRATPRVGSWQHRRRNKLKDARHTLSSRRAPCFAACPATARPICGSGNVDKFARRCCGGAAVAGAKRPATPPRVPCLWRYPAHEFAHGSSGSRAGSSDGCGIPDRRQTGMRGMVWNVLFCRARARQYPSFHVKVGGEGSPTGAAYRRVGSRARWPARTPRGSSPSSPSRCREGPSSASLSRSLQCQRVQVGLCLAEEGLLGGAAERA